MEKVTNIQDISNLEKNRIIGSDFAFNYLDITFMGENNVLYIDKKVELLDCKIVFSGSNSLIYINEGGYIHQKVHFYADVCNNSVLYIGSNNYFNPYGKIFLKCSEQKHIFIGNNGMLSGGVELNTSDSHLIYSAATGKRVNPSKSIYVGDSVWLGQNVLLLKGNMIHSGSIIGASSVLSGKTILSNCSAAGNPCKTVSSNIFWNGEYVHTFTEEKTDLYAEYRGEENIFRYDPNEYIPFSVLEEVFSEHIPAIEKIDKIKNLVTNKKNRFAFF